MREFALAILAAIATSGIAQTKTYEVKNGDTLGGIALRFNVSQRELVKLNHLANSHKLKLGQKLVIPKPQPKVAKKPDVPMPGQYKVRNGDHDWAIAAKFGIKPSQLRAMNPNVDWTRLQIGQVLRVPVKGSAKPMSGIAVKGAPSAKLAAAKTTQKWGFPTTAYRVVRGDNDWTIAHRFGIGLKKFKALNPTIDTAKLKPGQYVRVPGTAGTVAAASNVIRSRYGVIAKDAVIVRRGASTSTERITTVESGTPVSILDRQNGWYKLKFPRGTVGWVRGDMLKASKPPVMLASSVKRSGGSSRDARRPVYASKTTKKRSGSSFGAATKFVYGDNGGGNGDLVSNALGMLGARYRYGAASRSATDCSGLVIQAAKGSGIKLPRTSAAMSKVGKSVSKSELKPGDLVFFRTRGSRVSHVGIYQGNGKFIHASSSKGRVTVSNLNEGYYSRRYAGAKRVAPSTSSKKKTIKSDEPVKEKEVPTKEAAPKVETNEVDPKTVKNPDTINP